MGFITILPCSDVGISGGYFIGSVVCTTHGDGEGDGGRSNDGGGHRPAEPRKRENQEKGREMAGVEMDGRNVLAHSSFMPIKSYRDWTQSLREFWNVGSGLGGQDKTCER